MTLNVFELEIRIRELEQRIKSLELARPIPPHELWKVRALAKPGEDWPDCNVTKIWDGMLIEPYYDEESAKDISHRDYGDDEDPEQGSWIRFYCPRPVSEGEEFKVWRRKARDKNWFAFNELKLWRYCLAETHPGRGISFDVYHGCWDPDQSTFDFGGCSEVMTAIDWFYSDPEIKPGAGAQMWGVELPDGAGGVIVVAIDVDCDSPGPCCGGS